MLRNLVIYIRGILLSGRHRSTLHGIIAALSCAGMWWWFRPSLLNYESYLYAGGIEGFIDISGLYNVFVPEIRMPDFGRYHPNHPLPHLLVYGLWRITGWVGLGLPALDILTGLNFLASAVTVFFFFRIAMTLTADRTIAFLFSLLAGFSPVFWFSAVSAETYEVAYCLMVLAFLQMLRPYREETAVATSAKAFLFALAFSFHFGVSLFAIPIVAWYVVSASRRKSLRPLYSLVLFGSICLAVFVFVYIYLFMQIFGVETLREWWQIFSMQSRIPMGGQYSPEQGGLGIAAETLLTSLASGFLSGNGSLERLGRIHLLGAAAVAVIFVLRVARLRAFAAAQAAWIVIPVGFLLLVMRSPTNLTYSLMLMLPVFLAVVLLVRRVAPRPVARGVVLVWLLVTAGSTLATVILPKTGHAENSVYLASRIPVHAVSGGPAVALVHNYYGIFPDLYYLGNRRGLKPERIFFHYDQKFPQELLAEIRNKRELQLVTDRLLDHEESWLEKEGVAVERLFFHAELHPPEMYWFSIRPRFSVASGYRRELSVYRLKSG